MNKEEILERTRKEIEACKKNAIEHIEKEMDELLTIIRNKDANGMKAYLTKIRTNLAANK